VGGLLHTLSSQAKGARDDKLSTRTAALLGAGYVVCAGLLHFLAPLVGRATHLYADSLPPQPYFVPEHVALLYLGVPAAVLIVTLVLASPGVFLVLAFGHARRASVLVLQSAVAAWGVHLLAFLFWQAIGGSQSAFRTPYLLPALGTWFALFIRSRRGQAAALPVTESADRAVMFWTVAIPVLLTWFLLPVLLWQDFNPDGLEALTVGRSLNDWMIPRMPTGGATGLGLGMITIAYPIHWLIVFFGPIEAAARLPVALYTPVLFAGAISVAELGAPRRLTMRELSAMLIALGAFIVALGYNDTYHVYSADFASPANIDIAAVALMLAMCYALFAGQRWWFVAYTVLTYFTRPTAVMLLGLLVIAVVVVERKDRTLLRARLTDLGIALAACAVLLVAFERFFAMVAHVQFAEGTEHIGARIRYLRFDDVRRLLYVIVPSGVLPVLALLAYRRFDAVGRVLTLVTVGYFAFFFVLAFHVLHHFAPAMVLPVVIYWRWMLNERPRFLLVEATGALAVLAIIVSLPRTLTLDRSSRQIARAMSYRVGNYDGSYPEWRAAFRSKDMVDTLFPPYWKDPDPSRERMGSPWVFVHYATRGEIAPNANYVIQAPSAPPPAGFTLVQATDSGATFVRDLERWRRDRYGSFDTHFRSRVYDIPRESMLAIWGVPARRYTIDVRAVLDRLRGRRVP
jgi:hypothetical protein